MPDSHARAARFETHRPHLLAVATRLLGSATEAKDAVQEAWLRLDRAGDDGVENFGGWLTTVVGRICLDHLRIRSSPSRELVEFEWRTSAMTSRARRRVRAAPPVSGRASNLQRAIDAAVFAAAREGRLEALV